MIQRNQDPQIVDMEMIVDPLGRELCLPSDLVLIVCSLCNRFCTRDVPLWCRDVVRLYERHRMLGELAARATHQGRPQCRECLSYQSQQSRHGVGGWMDRAMLADQRMKE